MVRVRFRNDQKRFAYLHSLRATFRLLFKKCRDNGWSLKHMLDERSRILDGNGVTTSTGDWDKLTIVDKERIYGYWDALADTLLDELEFRYLIRGVWYTPNEVIEHKDGTDVSKDIPSPCDNGFFVHVLVKDGKTTYHPW